MKMIALLLALALAGCMGQDHPANPMATAVEASPAPEVPPETERYMGRCMNCERVYAMPRPLPADMVCWCIFCFLSEEPPDVLPIVIQIDPSELEGE